MSACRMEDNNSAVNKDNHVKSNACFYRKHRRHVFEMRGWCLSGTDNGSCLLRPKKYSIYMTIGYCSQAASCDKSVEEASSHLREHTN